MADDSIFLTSSFGRLYAQARIFCPTCGHGLLVDQTMLNIMFPHPLPLSRAVEKLVCSECGRRGGMLEVVRKAPR